MQKLGSSIEALEASRHRWKSAFQAEKALLEAKLLEEKRQVEEQLEKMRREVKEAF